LQAATPDGQQQQQQGCNSSGRDVDGDDGVECGAAYKLLMQYATSEEKLDEIAKALERGCTMTEGRSGCRVKNKVVWKVLDGACS
jgi:hypothetical protein